MRFDKVIARMKRVQIVRCFVPLSVVTAFGLQWHV